jgi:Raf kinase inhibitor-like YbhB/YbcL family protein
MRHHLTLVLLLVTVLAACGTSGRDLREPAPGATAPSRQPSAAGTREASSTTLGTVFAVTTDAWTPSGAISSRYTCDGANVSPPLVLSLIPEGTVELAVVVTDDRADRFIHWVVAGIDPSVTTLEEGEIPPGAVQALATDGEPGFSGPCPPDGDGPHTYSFTLHALTQPSGIQDGVDGATAVDVIEAASFSQSLLTGTYER